MNLLQETVWSIPIYSLVGALLSVLWFPSITKRTGPRPAGYVNLLLTVLAFAHSVGLLGTVWGQTPTVVDYDWLVVGDFRLSFPLAVSPVTAGAAVVITGLNLLAQVYAIGYLEMDWGWARFFALLGLFEGGMCALVFCRSLFFSYVILEILTLGTYLLVGVWYNQPLVVTGARDAFLTKRVGDLLLLMGVVALYPFTGTWNLDELAAWAARTDLDPQVMTWVGLGLLAGPVAKCAQLPFHLWLDEAMEGPLPSTILRNSVVVATGAWVLIQVYPVLALSPTVLQTAGAIGAATALGAALVAIAQIDLKRILSYLTSANLGIVFVAVATGELRLAQQWLLIHAVGMALLVMAVGAVIWNSRVQDVRWLGGLLGRRPISALTFLVGGATLVGLPPLAGFGPLSGLGQAWSTQPGLVLWLYAVMGAAALALTRAFALIFLGRPQPMSERSPEVHWPMILPMTVGVGVALNLPVMFWQWGFRPVWSPLTWMLPIAALVGVGLGLRQYGGSGQVWPVPPAWREFFARDFYSSDLYRLTMVQLVAVLSQGMTWVDNRLVDGAGRAVGVLTLLSGDRLRYTTGGQAQWYVLTVVLGTAGLVAWVWWQ